MKNSASHEIEDRNLLALWKSKTLYPKDILKCQDFGTFSVIRCYFQIMSSVSYVMIIGDLLNLFLGTELKMRKMKMVDLNIYF